VAVKERERINMFPPEKEPYFFYLQNREVLVSLSPFEYRVVKHVLFVSCMCV
jgi:hypothetical protein